ncbi:MAG: protein kinase domain-containing protein, partial [Acidimicrobiales bacterium]
MTEAGPDGTGRIGRVLAGRYHLVSFIASGGMAEVWEGRDALLARPVAVKMPLPHVARQDQAMRRFRREAVAAARLGHPNVVAVFDTGTDGPDSFIVMERVQGVSLREVLDREGALAVDRAVGIGAQVAAALAFAHRAGLVHRDVKPANILVTADGVVKVTDFGIAKAVLDEDLTQTNATVGTARYLAPEQIEGGPSSGRTDVYALGIVVYEMLCGRPPFEADSDIALAMKHLREPPPPPSSIRPDVPGWLEAVVLRALAKDPSARFETAAGLRRALLRNDALVEEGLPAPPGPGPVAAGSAGAHLIASAAWRDGAGTEPAPTPVAAAAAASGEAAVTGTLEPGATTSLLARPAGYPSGRPDAGAAFAGQIPA